MIVLGGLGILLALGVSAWGVVASLYGARTQRHDAIRSGEGAVKAAAVALTVSSGALFYAFLTRDFRLEYVASYSSRALSTFYTVGAFWAGQPGSLLLWAWVLALISAGVIYQNRARNRALMPYVTATLATVIGLFAFLVAFLSNPFETLPVAPADGMGLNPLLQNPGQWFHPLTIYLGYVGFTVPFAFCVAALATGRLNDEWIRTVRKWTLWAWLFLTAGVFWGARWAYVELGWGGYWGWDPVENASLLPWLTGTAYLHSVMIQEKRGMLKVWNVALAIATFALSLFGTFLTRSGVISSVHAFAESPIGPFLIVATMLTVLLGGGLLVWRLPQLKSKVSLDSFASREASFLLNNVLLVGIAFAVFWGTVFPLVAEAVRGVKVSVGPPFYETVVPPIAIVLLALVGICPLLAWRRPSMRNLRRNFLIPLSAGAAATAVFVFLTNGQHLGAVTLFGLASFVTATLVLEYYRGAKARRRVKGVGWGKAFAGLFSKNPRRYGGYLIHFGVVVLLVGIGVHVAFKTSHRTSLEVGESTRIEGYSLTLDDIRVEQSSLKLATIGVLEVTKDGKKLGTINSEKALYQNEDQPTSEVGIWSSPTEDLYVILESADPAARVASLQLLVNPGVFWIWVGGLIALGGGVIVALPERRRAAPDVPALKEVPSEPQRVPARV